MSSSLVYHLDATKNQIGKYIFLAGDPGRIPRIASHFDSAASVTNERGFAIWTGKLAGRSVSAVSTGIGCPSAAIVVEELIALGAHTFLRIGTCGSLQDNVKVGDIVITSAAIRDEGTTRQYASIEIPAIANSKIVAALQSSVIDLEVLHHVGIVHCKDSFYSELPEFTVDPSYTVSRWEIWRRAGILATEMEVAVIYPLSQLRGCRAGAVLSVVGSTLAGDLIQPRLEEQIDRLIDVGIRAMCEIIRQDKGD